MKEKIEVTGLVQILRESFFGVKSKGVRTNTRLIALMGVYIALCIVFERTIYIPVGDTSRYSLTFVVVALAGITLGGLRGGIVAALADIIGSLQIYGSVSPLITICVFISAITFGVLLYKKRNILTIVFAVLIDQILSCLILKTGALALYYYGGMNAYGTVFLTRLPQVAIMIPIEIVVLIVLNRYLFGRAKRMVKDFTE